MQKETDRSPKLRILWTFEIDLGIFLFKPVTTEKCITQSNLNETKKYWNIEEHETETWRAKWNMQEKFVWECKKLQIISVDIFESQLLVTFTLKNGIWKIIIFVFTVIHSQDCIEIKPMKND